MTAGPQERCRKPQPTDMGNFLSPSAPGLALSENGPPTTYARSSALRGVDLLRKSCAPFSSSYTRGWKVEERPHCHVCPTSRGSATPILHGHSATDDMGKRGGN